MSTEIERRAEENAVILEDGPVLPVIYHTSPFANEVQYAAVVEGATISSIVANSTGKLPAEYLPYLRVWINDQEIAREEWSTFRVQAGQNVYIRVVPGKSGKDIFRVIAMIAVVVVAAVVAPYLAPSVASALGVSGTAAIAGVTAGLTAAITMVGFLAINALIPPPSLGGNGKQDDPRFDLTSTSNQFAPYGNIPRVFGKRRLYPMMAARPYAEIQGDDEYLRMALVVGWGPLKIENIKIGETPIAAFNDVEVEVREGWSTDSNLTIFSRTVTEENLSVRLEPDAGYGRSSYNIQNYYWDADLQQYVAFDPLQTYNSWASRTTAANAVEFIVDISFPSGLFYFNDKGDKENATVVVEVQYRAVGATTWINAPWANSSETGFGTAGRITVTAADSSAVRRSGRVKLPTAGQYEVRMRRTTIDNGAKYVDATYWTNLRTVKPEYPVQQKNVALIAIRMKASNQLNGVPQQISCEATSYLPVWNGSTWSYQLSRNPAWAYTDLLRRRGGEVFLSDDRLDLNTLKDWATACDTTAPNASEPRWTYDDVLEGGSIFDNLRRVAGNSRAFPVVRDGKHSVVRDIQQTVPVQHITPRNSWSYSGSKAFIDYPHALRVTFANAAKNYQQDERIVYDDGYSAVNATKFETLEMTGCTSPTMAYREARYHMAVARLRPEEHTVQMDIEALRCTVGDLVRFSHDAIAIGIAATRVRSRVVDGTNKVTSITFDDDLYFEAGKSYAIRTRRYDGTSVLLSINNPGAGYANTVTPVTPPLSSAAPDVGDLTMFGEATKESAPMIIKKIEPSEDLTCTVTMVDAADGVHSADTGTIPAFDSFITLPTDTNAINIPQTYISAVRSDDSTAIVNPDGSIFYRILVQVQQAEGSTARVEYFEVQYRIQTTSVWQTIRIERGNGFGYINNPEIGQVYELRSRSVSTMNQPSAWSPTITHTALGKNRAPGVPSGLSATPMSGGIHLAWTNPVDNDLWQIEVFENTANAIETATLREVVTGTTYDRLGLTSSDGPRFFWIRAVNTSGINSALVGPVSTTALNKLLALTLTNEAIALASNVAGTVSSFTQANGLARLFDGDTEVTSSATFSVTMVGCTGTINTATNTPVSGQPKGYYAVTAMSLSQASLTISATYNGVTVSKVFSLTKAVAGSDGITNAIVYIYKRSATTPALPTATTTYTFATGGLTGLDNGWSSTIPAGTDPLYVSTATASATAALTDNIAANEWAAPVVLAQNGSNGSNGSNTATVFLFKRTSAPDVPAKPTTAGTYTFSTGAITGIDNDWVQSMPTTGGQYRWMITATALGTGTTDTIAATEWSTPSLLAVDGTAGTNAINISMSRASASVWAYADGSVPSWTSATGVLKVFDGTTDVTTSATLSATAGTGVTGTIDAAGNYSVTAMTVDSGTLTITIVYAGVTYTRLFTVVKQKAGYEIVGTLPTTNLFEGRMVFLTTNDKLYRYTGAAWTLEVDGADIKAGSITAAKMDVTHLSAISATIGTLRTATTGARTEIKDNLIEVYDANNVLRVRIGVW